MALLHHKYAARGGFPGIVQCLEEELGVLQEEQQQGQEEMKPKEQDGDWEPTPEPVPEPELGTRSCSEDEQPPSTFLGRSHSLGTRQSGSKVKGVR